MKTLLSTSLFKYAQVSITCTSRASSIEILNPKIFLSRKVILSKYVISDGASNLMLVRSEILSVELLSTWLQK